MTTKLRLASLLAVLAIAAIAFGATALTQRNDVLAGNPPDEYSLSVSAPAIVPVFSPFTVKLGIVHPFGVVDCTAADNTTPPIPIGCYKGVSWKATYDSTIIATTAPATAASFAKDPAAPSACNLKSVSQIGAGSSVTAACADTSPTGVTLNYSGNAWNIQFTCVTAGTSPLAMVAGTDTFVSDGLVNLPFHTHDAPAVTCVDTADVEAFKTGPATVNAGDPIVYTVICTNNGPQAWTEPVCADDLPDTIDASGCTAFPVTPSGCAVVSFDLDGDSLFGVPDDNGGSVDACAFLPVFPGIVNLIACQAESVLGPGATIPVNGSMMVVVTVAAAADSCGDTLVDVGIATSNDNDASTSPGGPPSPDDGNAEIIDPDFLDGVQGTENNFAPFVTQVGDCPVTILKEGPAGGITGDAGSYTLTVSNAGPSQATGVVVTDTVPAGLTITSVVGTGCGFVGQVVTCNTGTILAGGSEIITINFTMTTPGAFCNTASATWVSGPTDSATTTSNELCFTALPPFNGLVKCVDLNGDTDTADEGECPGQGEDTIQVNLWLCTDQSDDGIDNDGDSTVDNEAATCTKTGEGSLTISEQIFTRADCDTRNDDDDGDGEPVSNDPNSPGFRPECPSPTLQDFIDDNDGDGNGNVDKNGGEIGEGLGAFEFQLKFDHKIFDITITGETAWANGRFVNCTMTIITENDIRFGCVSQSVFDPTNIEDADSATPGPCDDTLDNGGDSGADAADNDCYDGLGFQQASGIAGATITVTPEADLIFRIRATKDNGVVRRLLDENCEVADIFGDIFPNTDAGLTPDCTDIDITVRRLEGDVDADCDVDVNDAQRIAFRYGSFFGHLVFDQNFDLEPWPTGDFDIDIKDLQFIFGRIGSSCSDPVPDNQDPLVATGVGQP